MFLLVCTIFMHTLEVSIAFLSSFYFFAFMFSWLLFNCAFNFCHFELSISFIYLFISPMFSLSILSIYSLPLIFFYVEIWHVVLFVFFPTEQFSALFDLHPAKLTFYCQICLIAVIHISFNSYIYFKKLVVIL